MSDGTREQVQGREGANGANGGRGGARDERANARPKASFSTIPAAELRVVDDLLDRAARELAREPGGYVTLAAVGEGRSERNVGRLDGEVSNLEDWFASLVDEAWEDAIDDPARMRLRLWGSGGRPAGSASFQVGPHAEPEEWRRAREAAVRTRREAGATPATASPRGAGPRPKESQSDPTAEFTRDWPLLPEDVVDEEDEAHAHLPLPDGAPGCRRCAALDARLTERDASIGDLQADLMTSRREATRWRNEYNRVAAMYRVLQQRHAEVSAEMSAATRQLQELAGGVAEENDDRSQPQGGRRRPAPWTRQAKLRA